MLAGLAHVMLPICQAELQEMKLQLGQTESDFPSLRRRSDILLVAVITVGAVLPHMQCAPGWETESVETNELPGEHTVVWRDKLYSIGSVNPRLYRFEGKRWEPVSRHLEGTVRGMVVWRDRICVAGAFTNSSSTGCQNVACWNGTNWFALGSGLDGDGLSSVSRYVIEMTSPTLIVPTKDRLCVFGTFSIAGGVGVHCAAVWDGAKWRPFVEGPISRVSDQITALSAVGESVVAAGRFTAAGRIASPNLARWEGNDSNTKMHWFSRWLTRTVFCMSGEGFNMRVEGRHLT